MSLSSIIIAMCNSIGLKIRDMRIKYNGFKQSKKMYSVNGKTLTIIGTTKKEKVETSYLH